MPFAEANGITLCYDVMGPEDGRPLLLIMGLTTQLIAWPEVFCRQLADAGHRVIRFDNRDCGLSTKMERLGVPDVMNMAGELAKGHSVAPPYTLSDMAADAVGLADALGLERFHVCGLSMGGMIAQIMAMEYPARILSLVSMESTTGERDLPPATPEAAAAMISLAPTKRDRYIAYSVDLYRAFAAGSRELDEGVQARLSAAAYDRAFYPMGFPRQMAAILAAPGRRRALGAVACPALVIHGTHDAMVPAAHGEDTAHAISGAELLMMVGLGHGIAYPRLWLEMTGRIAELTHKAGG
ncbi:MAG: alpha/beta hydrolase [Pseudomonadota bacterium]